MYTIAVEGTDAHLIYELEIPKEPQDLQNELNIGKTGNYSLQMKVHICAAAFPGQMIAFHMIVKLQSMPEVPTMHELYFNATM